MAAATVEYGTGAVRCSVLRVSLRLSETRAKFREHRLGEVLRRLIL